MVPRRDRGSTGVTAAACGLTSDSTTVNTSGFSPLAVGRLFSMALGSDGTVAGWGSNGHGQLNVPPELTNVVQVAGGDHYSLALKADGTVVVSGNDDSSKSTVQDGLVAAVP